MTRPIGIHALCNGRLVDVAEDGKAELLTCAWLIQVPSGNPEPDFIEDTYRIVECGAPLFAFGSGGWRCDAGHHHHPYGSDEQQAEERLEAMFGQ